MKANFKSGSVRGVRSNSHPYRDRFEREKESASATQHVCHAERSTPRFWACGAKHPYSTHELTAQ